MITPYYRSSDRAFTLLHGDSLELLPQFDFRFDMIFADPPYFLSNGGISVQSGKIVCVDKGEWDKGCTMDELDAFNRRWLSLCRAKLKENGSIWVSGTYHNIFSVARQLTDLGYKILNVITWAKTNPPPNISFWEEGRSPPPEAKAKDTLETGRITVPSGVLMGAPMTVLESMRDCRFFMELSVRSPMWEVAINFTPSFVLGPGSGPG